MKKIVATIIVFILIIMNVFNYAIVSAVSITEDELEETLEKIEQETGTSGNEGFTMNKQEKEIEINIEESSVIVKYDLSEDITFTSDLSITRDDVESGNGEGYGYGMAGPMMMLIVVAENEGISYEDASAYFMWVLLDNISKNYIENGEISLSTDTDQFDMLKEQINKGISIDDRLFSITIEKVKETDDSIDAKCILTISEDAEFSVMEGAAEDLAGDVEGSLGDIMGNMGNLDFGDTDDPADLDKVNDTDEPTVDELLKEESPKEEPAKQETPEPSVAQKVIPKTGESDILYILLPIAIVFTIISGIGMIYSKKRD